MKMKFTLILKHMQVFIGITLGIGCLVLARPLLGEDVEPNSLHQSHVRLIYVKIGKLEKAIAIYMMNHNGKTPASLNELALLVKDSNDQPLLTKEDLIDPWGEPFGYEHEGRKYVFWSSGPDKKLGTKDDVFEGRPGSYEASWRAKLTQETNTGQEATAEITQPPASTAKATPNRGSTATAQPPAQPDNPAGTKATPWKLPLLIGILGGVAAAWCCFRRK